MGGKIGKHEGKNYPMSGGMGKHKRDGTHDTPFHTNATRTQYNFLKKTPFLGAKCNIVGPSSGQLVSPELGPRNSPISGQKDFPPELGP